MISDLIISIVFAGLLSGNNPALANYYPTSVLYADDHIEYTATEHLPVNVDAVQAPKKINESLGVEINAKAAAIADVESGAILWEKEPEKVLPIASITKLMTASVFFDNNPGWKKVETLDPDENDVIGAKFSTGPGTELYVEDVFYITLTGSANNTARALAHSTGLSEEEFAKAMNAKASELKMDHSTFVEPSGLEKGNVSTAEDLLKLATHAFSYPEVRRATTIPSHSLRTITGDEERTVKATNKLLKSYLNEAPYQIIAGKTGYTEEAGFCLVQQTRYKDHDILIAVMNADTENDRNEDMEKLVEWTYNNYEW